MRFRSRGALRGLSAGLRGAAGGGLVGLAAFLRGVLGGGGGRLFLLFLLRQRHFRDSPQGGPV
ncbi:MAG: hypothetical protein ACK5YW_16005 [Betaproteobacteria bacterium]